MRSRDRSRSPYGRGGYGGSGGRGGGYYDRRRSSPPPRGGYGGTTYPDRSPPRYPPGDRDYPPARRDDTYPPRGGADYVPQRRASPRYDDRAARKPPADSGKEREDYGRGYR